MNYKLTIEEADVLLEKYYDGLTTVSEERQLQAFLSGEDLPARFGADKAILGYFKNQKQPRGKGIIMPLFRWTAAAVAAVAVILLAYHSRPISSTNNYAYINGKLVTNSEMLQASALASIQGLNSTSEDVRQSTTLLNDDQTIINQQLSQFSELDQ